jgi:hypothetical protein
MKRSVIVVDGPLSFRMRRLEAARACTFGLEILSLPLLAVRLAGGLSQTMWAGCCGSCPSLPSRQVILLGWAAPIPALVEVDELPHAQRPQSADPDFWNVRMQGEERGVDWSAVSKEWSGAPPAQEPE